MSDETLFKHSEKKWIPINKQSALITRRASPLLLHTPPAEPPKKEPSISEKLAQESKIRRQRIANLEREAEERRKRRTLVRQQNQKPKSKPKWKNMWAVRHLKRMAKSRGLPAPSHAECQAYRMAQPNYGKTLT